MAVSMSAHVSVNRLLVDDFKSLRQAVIASYDLLTIIILYSVNPSETLNSQSLRARRTTARHFAKLSA